VMQATMTTRRNRIPARADQRVLPIWKTNGYFKGYCRSLRTSFELLTWEWNLMQGLEY
jgi:hypothetical protein